MPTLFISAYPFAQFNQEPLKLLQAAGIDILRHPFERKIKSDEILPYLQQADAVIAGTEIFEAATLQQCPQLKFISRIGVGTDNIDLAACQQLGIQVLTTPDAATEAVAEYCIGLMLVLCRGIGFSHQQLKAGKWQRYFGLELAQARLGLIGLGRIGQAVAHKAKALGMSVSAYDPMVSADVFDRLKVQSMSLEALLQNSQIVSLHAPANAMNHHLINTRTLALMPQNSYLINTARGSLIDEIALYESLKSAHLAGAALDVFEQEPYSGPLKKLDNIILSAHQAANSQAARIRMEVQAVENLLQEVSKRKRVIM